MRDQQAASWRGWYAHDASDPDAQLALFVRVSRAPRSRRELGELGRETMTSWSRGARAPDRELPDGSDTLRWASDLAADISLDEAFALLPTQFAAFGSFTEQSTQRLTSEIAKFCQRLQLEGVISPRLITPVHARRFIDDAVPVGTGYAVPAVATQYLRRSAIRTFVGILRSLHLFDGDPTLDITLPPRGEGLRTRQFEDDEELQGRIWSRQTLVETRMPSLWALGQATANTGETAQITIGDVALDDSQVWIHGSNKREPRSGQLTDWGVEQLRRRIEHLDGDLNTRIVFDGAHTGASGQASVSRALYVVLVRAGLTDDPGLRAGSLPAWAGRKIFEQTANIEQTARALGVRSLDQAARIIGYEWR